MDTDAWKATSRYGTIRRKVRFPLPASQNEPVSLVNQTIRHSVSEAHSSCIPILSVVFSLLVLRTSFYGLQNCELAGHRWNNFVPTMHPNTDDSSECLYQVLKETE